MVDETGLKLTLSDLQEADGNKEFPTADLIALMQRYGFEKISEGSEQWAIKGNRSIPAIRIPGQYSDMISTVWQKIKRALETIEKDQKKEEGPAKFSDAIENKIKETRDFDIDREASKPDLLVVFAKKAPEFRFDMPVKDNETLNLRTLDSYLETYADASGQSPSSLKAYLAGLERLGANEWGVERGSEGAFLKSKMKDTPDVPLMGTPETLIDLIKNASDDAELYRMDQQEKALQSAAATADSEKAAPPTETPTAAPEPAAPAEIRAALVLDANRIKAPGEGQHVLVLDSSAIIELGTLSFSKYGRDSSMLDILKETLKLPNIGKIIIPDFIADFEVRGQGTHYDKNGQMFVSHSIHDDKMNGNDYKDVRRNFQRLIHNAVRRHVKEDGTVEYLHNADVKPDEVNTNIIIWETPRGRKFGEDIYTKLNAGDRDGVYSSYVTDRSGEKSIPKNYGEQEIEAVVDDKNFYKAPVHILTSDKRYINDPKNNNKTGTGQSKAYHTTFEYLDAELKLRGDKHREKIGTTYKTAKEAYDSLEQSSGGKMGMVRLNRRAISASEDEAPGMYALIHDGLLAASSAGAARPFAAAPPPTRPQPAAPLPPLKPVRVPVVAPAPAAEAAPKPKIPPEAKSLGAYLLILMNEKDLNRSDFAKLINAELPEDQQLNITQVREILAGKIPVDEPLLEVIAKVVIEDNPGVNDKEDAQQKLREMWQKAKAAQENMAAGKAVDAEHYHGFGGYVATLLDQRHLTDTLRIAEAINEQIGVLKPEEKTIDEALVKKICAGEHIPSPGLAIAMRNALGNPQGFDDAYSAARTANPTQSRLQQLRT